MNSTEINSEDFDFSELISKYEKLVDVVCAGAKFGSSKSLELRYSDIQEWMNPRLKTLESYLIHEDASNPEKVVLLLEKVISSPTLDHLLLADDGSLIQRMSWISNALFSL
jgi:hypothetical protein